MAKLAIVFIIHNSFGRLKFMLEQLDVSAYEDFEIFVIDNKSSDYYRDILMDYLPEKEFKYDVNVVELEDKQSIAYCEGRAKEYITKKNINSTAIYNLT
jgi:hypothetical protein